MYPLDDCLLDAASAQARTSARRHHMHWFHQGYEEPVQRMLNALEPDSYVPPGIRHTILALDPGTVAYEVKAGPYDPARAKEAAPWVPPEGDPRAPAYLARLRAAIAAAHVPTPASVTWPPPAKRPSAR